MEDNKRKLSAIVESIWYNLKWSVKALKTLKFVAHLLHPQSIKPLRKELAKSHNSCCDKVQKQMYRADYNRLIKSIEVLTKSVEHCHRSYLQKYEEKVIKIEDLCNKMLIIIEVAYDNKNAKRIQELTIELKKLINKEKLAKDDILAQMYTHEWNKQLITATHDNWKKIAQELRKLVRIDESYPSEITDRSILTTTANDNVENNNVIMEVTESNKSAPTLSTKSDEITLNLNDTSNVERIQNDSIGMNGIESSEIMVNLSDPLNAEEILADSVGINAKKSDESLSNPNKERMSDNSINIKEIISNELESKPIDDLISNNSLSVNSNVKRIPDDSVDINANKSDESLSNPSEERISDDSINIKEINEIESKPTDDLISNNSLSVNFNNSSNVERIPDDSVDINANKSAESLSNPSEERMSDDSINIKDISDEIESKPSEEEILNDSLGVNEVFVNVC